MKIKHLRILSALILFLFVIFFSIQLSSRDIKVYSLNFEISNTSGFDLNSSALTFGKIIPDSSASRYVSIENDNSHEIYVEVTSSKNLLSLLKVSENEFFLLPGEKKVLEFSVIVPKNASMGKYDGKVSIKMREKSHA